MAHKFDGTWTLKLIAERGVPPNAPSAGGDTILAINDAGVIDTTVSFMDGRRVLRGTATETTIDVFTTGGRRYFGNLVHPAIVASQPIFTIAGRFGPGQATPLASSAPEPKRATATKGKAANTATAAAAAQDQGGWVITKP
jgi:hypothetical protein